MGKEKTIRYTVLLLHDSISCNNLLLDSMFPEKIEFDGEKYRTNSYNKVLEWIFQNTNDLQNKKTEEQDQKSLSSVSVPGAGLFSEPFLKDLELIWGVALERRNRSH